MVLFSGQNAQDMSYFPGEHALDGSEKQWKTKPMGKKTTT